MDDENKYIRYDWAMKDGFFEEYAKGYAEGFAKGLQQGRAEGQHEEKLKTAKAMKVLGLDDVTIQKVTGLTLEDIAEL